MNQRKRLEEMANRIDAVLAAHGTPGRVTGGRVGVYTIHFLFAPENGSDAERALALGPTLADALDVPACTISLETAFDSGTGFSRRVSIEVPNPAKPQLDVLDIVANYQPLPRMTAVLGLKPEGGGLFANLTSQEAGHILATGPGGLNLVRVVALSLAHARPGQVAYVAVGDRLADLVGLGGFVPSRLAPQLVKEAARLTRQYTAQGYRTPETVLLFDSLNGLPRDALVDLLRHGRAVGTHVVAASDGRNGLRFPLHLQPHGADHAAHIGLNGEVVPFVPATIGNVQAAVERLPGSPQVATLPRLKEVV